MKTLLINGNEYKLEFTFEASEHKDTVQKMFKVLSGAYLMRKGVVIDETDEEKGVCNCSCCLLGCHHLYGYFGVVQRIG